MKLNRKGVSIDYIVPAVITLVVIIVVGAVGLLIADETKSQSDSTDADINKSIDYGIEGITTIMQWLPLIGLVLAAVIIIGLIMGNLGKTM